MQTAETEETAETETAAANLDQDSTPLVDALAEAAGNVRSPLFYPGHKMGRYERLRVTREHPRSCSKAAV